MVNVFSEKENTDISSLDIDLLQGKISNEDLDRLKKSRPQTLRAAIRAGIK